MKKVVLILWLLVLGNIGMKAEFRHIVRVDKKVSELKDTIDLSSPLGAFTASAYMQVILFALIKSIHSAFVRWAKVIKTVKYSQK